MLDRLVAAVSVVPFALGAAAAPSERATVAFTFTDPEIVESSGLAVVDDLVVTTNDSGDTGRVFVVDPASGDTIAETHWSDDPGDVEAVAATGDGTVWVADIGDNSEARNSVRVAEVPVARENRDVDPVSYELVYPDGAHDAETLLSHPETGRLYVATKEVFGGILYELPARLDADGPNELRELGPVLAAATDGTFFPDGRHFVVRNYGRAVIYAFPSLQPVAELDLPMQQQGEGIAVDAGGGLLLSTEGLNTDVLRLTLPRDVREALQPESTSPPAPSPSPSPSTVSRGDSELPETTETQRPVWPWLVSGLFGLVVIVVLLVSLRRPDRR
jgi:hypothetical protein